MAYTSVWVWSQHRPIAKYSIMKITFGFIVGNIAKFGPAKISCYAVANEW